MTLDEAKQIREWKKSCTYRRLAELFYPESDRNHGDQYAGMDLCREALKVLYPNDEIWGMYKPEEKFGKQFEKENKSYHGDFYWWE